MKKCFVIGLIMALVPQVGAIAAQKTVDMLIAEKQAKIKKLEKCKGTTKDLKIAGISTLGITAVGVGANIAEAVVLDDYKGKVNKEKTELEKQQDLQKSLQAQAQAKAQAQTIPAKTYDPSNDVVDTCEDAKKLLISKTVISAADSCVCTTNEIACGNSTFVFKEIKETARIDTTEIKVKTCGEAKALLLKHKMIDAKATCECEEDAITCGTKTFYFDKIEKPQDNSGNAKAGNGSSQKCGDNQKLVNGKCQDKDVDGLKSKSSASKPKAAQPEAEPKTCDPACANGQECKDGKCVDTSEKNTDKTKKIADKNEATQHSCSEGQVWNDGAGECIWTDPAKQKSEQNYFKVDDNDPNGVTMPSESQSKQENSGNQGFGASIAQAYMPTQQQINELESKVQECISKGMTYDSQTKNCVSKQNNTSGASKSDIAKSLCNKFGGSVYNAGAGEPYCDHVDATQCAELDKQNKDIHFVYEEKYFPSNVSLLPGSTWTKCWIKY